MEKLIEFFNTPVEEMSSRHLLSVVLILVFASVIATKGVVDVIPYFLEDGTELQNKKPHQQ